ncbi:amine oxidase [flavin-containing]-like [Rhincodon typus]|uniref:amine oxidase [flavin-containing]-like n=1 Tax=Rhincodon typus TaxID=259920 RepID=UPI00202E8F50|nr:amine oxidase [flavin-containing]-like [Rhincodon typus]
MDGAVQAGERAAREVMCTIGIIPETAIWTHEPEVQEVPSRPIITTFWERHLPSVPGFLMALSVSTCLAVAGVIMSRKICLPRA